jgi:short-subunit dehydrogenase
VPTPRKQTVPTQNRGTALITGASSGIGAVYADRLAKRGYGLIIVTRNRNRLDLQARRLTNETERSVEVLAADLNSKGDLSRVEDTLKSDSSITHAGK